MSNISIEGGANAPQEPSKFEWQGAQALRRVHALNERCLELMTQLARAERQQITLVIVNQHRTLWRGLNVTSRKRAAHMPFLLMDVHFQDELWWQAAQGPRPQRVRTGGLSAFTGKIAAELMREALMLSWSTVALDRGIASVLLGMAPAVTGIISELGPQDVERIAAHCSQHLRPRWQDFPAFWGKLLTAARDGDEETIYECRLHGVQLIGSELLSSLNGRFV